MDAYEQRKRDWEDLEVTKEELKDLTKCLKTEEFRKLLIEYAEEVNDPENKKLYQKEITQLEKQRGVDVTFVNPEPGYVIKTSINGEKKCFLNISQSKIVDKPSSQPSQSEGNRGLQWSIPYTLVPPRDDLDKKNVRCVVFDVVFHPDTLYLTSKNSRFRELVNNTAIDGVESNFKVKIDRKNLKFPKLNFKGVSQPSVIRKPGEKPAEQSEEPEPEIYQKILSSYDNYREQHSKRCEEKPQRSTPKSTYYKNVEKSQESDSKFTTPKYVITHQTDIDLDEYTYSKDAKMHSAIPKRLVVVIDLPLLKSASDATLDIHERSLTLKSDKPAKYLLKLTLPYCVDGNSGNAKFDAKYKKLTITLPVIRKKLTLDQREDSGVDTDHGSPVRDANEESIANFQHPETIAAKSDSRPLIVELSSESEVQVKELQDTALRTRESAEITPFMNPNIKYSIPAFTCNVYDNILAITIHVKNVDSETICRRVLDNMSGIHVLLTSVGAGFFPVYYSICFKLEENSVDPDSITVEPWDNNVIITLALKSTELKRYFVGIDDEFLEAKDFSSAVSVKNKLKELMEEPEEETDKTIDVVRNGENVTVSIHSNSVDTDDEDQNLSPVHQERKHDFDQIRSISESSGDELPSSNGSTYRSKGILKSHRNNFSRSVSESSIDESAGLASSVNFQYDSVQELNSESESSSLKKTVRFNDVVSRQLYRSNSSILGQRKKNQRKLRNKKRAHDRRMSESENSETEERDKYKVELKCEEDASQSDSVRPILSKNSENQKTDNIEIEASRINGTNPHKRKSNKKRNEVLVHNKETESGDEIHAEFKNDLIFDLDM